MSTDTGTDTGPVTGSGTATDTATSTGTGSGSADTAGAQDAAGARPRIDELDARIIALVQERRSVSAGIQQARIAAGGTRVHLAREMEILDRYRGELGRHGTQLAMTLLTLCRGRL
ncbi:chorismate mutase [Streptomyces sp. Amel2xB2]|uniref:chorismate mutase n=1 Tax=Streptomyces sp. Amel2xB2 TaxID=1305829 RepID=UPI000DB96C9B|nr:chorismate mutase [Streptomyces sp. Amel2xB2]RAJ71813.1 chorismate mutase [Streptomyces sp. Amel2xB2]